MNFKIAQVVVGLPVEGPFDYSVGPSLEGKIAVGQRAQILFNRRKRVGYVVKLKQKSAFKELNPILEILDRLPLLDEKVLKLTKLFSEYYGCSWGEAIETWLPAALRGNKPVDMDIIQSHNGASSKTGRAVLLHDKGVHQRWPFLAREIQKALETKKSIIFLVPEVSYIEPIQRQLSQRVSAAVVVLDKKLSALQELEQWVQIRRGAPVLVLGTRSAVFAPVLDLGLIVIYDEENSSYKQGQTPHYHAHEAARMRSKIEQCSLIYVSSAPSAEVWALSKKRELEKITFESDHVSAVQVVDMTNYNPRRSSILSFPFQNAMQKVLEENGKVLLFMNRKGFSTRTSCNQCGFTLRCGRCDVNLTYLYSKKVMVCRHCGFNQVLPKVCPGCKGSYLRSTGMGIEKLESEVSRIYPQVYASRYDRETERFPRKADVIIATQAILKIQDDNLFDLVGVLNFDAELHHMDFRSAQRAFSLLVRLRQLAKEKLFIQTRLADNYCIEALRKWDFDYFYKKELKHRKELEFPPYKHLVAIGLRGEREDVVFELSKGLSLRLEQAAPESVEVSDPHPDVNPKLRDKYRLTIILKGNSVKSILSLAKSALKGLKRKRGAIVTLNVDP